MDYHDRKFKLTYNSENGEVSGDMVFHYLQEGNILTCTYRDSSIKIGHLIGIVNADGVIDMRYHQISKNGELMTGICKSKPEVLDNGKIQLHEDWEWTSGDKSKGKSILTEI